MKIAALASVLALSIATPAFADNWTVNSTRDAVDRMPGDGACATATPLAGGGDECTLRAAVQEANARRFVARRSHTIHLPAGHYVLGLAPHFLEEDQQRIGTATSAIAVQTGDLDINVDVTIAGDGPGLTIVDGAGLDRVFDVWSQYTLLVRFEQLSLRNGFTRGPGGCLYHRGGRAEVQLFLVTIDGCVSDQQVGGGMMSAGFTDMLRVAFRGNTAVRGGGFENSSQALIEDSTFDGNTAAFAPGSPGLGGGISNISTAGAAPWIRIRNSTISNNTANIGGGVLNQGTLTMFNSTVSGNRAGVKGGGFAFFDAASPDGRGDEALDLLYTTVVNNGSIGILRETTSRLSLSHTLVAGNGGKGSTNCAGGVTNSNYSLEDANDCGLIGEGDLTSVDPLIAPLAANGGHTWTHALLPGSPAIDAGLPGGRASERRDQRGTPRPLGGATDIGAFEFGLDPGALLQIIPLGWTDLMRYIDRTGAVRFAATLTLRTTSGAPPARFIGIKTGDGASQVQFSVSKRGRRLSVSGLALPAKPGANAADSEAVLFYVEVQRALGGKTVLRAAASCACKLKPKKPAAIVIPPYQLKQP